MLDLGRFAKLRSWVFMISWAASADETTRTGTLPKWSIMRGPWRWAKVSSEWWGCKSSWWRFPMIGSFGGEGGEFFLVFLFGRKEDHLNWSMKMKAKMVKTKVWSNMDVTFGTKNCRKFDIFISLFQASVCRFWMFKVCRVSLVDVPLIFNFHIYISNSFGYPCHAQLPQE